MLAATEISTLSAHRDAWLEIDLAAISHNFVTIKSWINSSTSLSAHVREIASTTATPGVGNRVRTMCVVKADGYGHGASAIAQHVVALGCDWLAVATADEGVQLREVVADRPILVLGPIPGRAIKTALERNLDLTVVNAQQIRQITDECEKSQVSARLQIKLDTGMHRLGARPNELVALANQIAENPLLKLTGIFSHLAQAEEQIFTEKQNSLFKDALTSFAEHFPGKLNREGGEVIAHIASGDAARCFPETHWDCVRAGLSLYGLAAKSVSPDVIPALSLRGRINQVRQIEAGEAVGYNLTWRADKPTILANLPIGYADGVDRGLSNRINGSLHGVLVKQVGTISMDQMIFDITDVVPAAKEGDVITLIGQDGSNRLTLAAWAVMLDTITYELACRLKLRLPRYYHQSTPQKSGNPQ